MIYRANPGSYLLVAGLSLPAMAVGIARHLLMMRLEKRDPLPLLQRSLGAIEALCGRQPDHLDALCFCLATVAAFSDLLASTAGGWFTPPLCRVRGIPVCGSPDSSGGADLLEASLLALFTRLMRALQTALEPALSAFFHQPSRTIQVLRGYSTVGTDDLIAGFTGPLSKLQSAANDAHLCTAIQKQLLLQTFHYLGSWLFNQLVREDEFCTTSSAMRIKLWAAQLDSWLGLQPSFRSHAAIALEQLEPLLQAATLLACDHANKVYETQLSESNGALKSAFPALNAVQILRLVSQYRTDSIGQQQVSSSILRAAQQAALRNTTLELELDCSQLLPLPVEV
jgi:hypothetical protein